jgi:hypothetical protein
MGDFAKIFSALRDPRDHHYKYLANLEVPRRH